MAACGQAFENQMSNADACRILRQAIDKKCTGADEIDWLNCDVLPGCPGGVVDGDHIRNCQLRIEVSPECADVYLVECAVAKLDCGGPSGDQAGGSITFKDVCNNLTTTLVGKGCAEASVDCTKFVKCKRAAFQKDDLTACVKAVENESDCGAATTRAEKCTIGYKYCTD